MLIKPQKILCGYGNVREQLTAFLNVKNTHNIGTHSLLLVVIMELVAVQVVQELLQIFRRVGLWINQLILAVILHPVMSTNNVRGSRGIELRISVLLLECIWEMVLIGKNKLVIQ